jgi:hypothetical protein
VTGVRRKRIRHLPRSEWQVLIPEHHPGFIDWQTYEANQARLASNTRPGPHKVGGAVREGNALLQGLASCGHCGRRLHTHYRGRNSSPGYHCPGKILVAGRGDRVEHRSRRPLDDLVLQSGDGGCIMHLVQLGFGDGEARRGDLATQSRRL